MVRHIVMVFVNTLTKLLSREIIMFKMPEYTDKFYNLIDEHHYDLDTIIYEKVWDQYPERMHSDFYVEDLPDNLYCELAAEALTEMGYSHLEII